MRLTAEKRNELHRATIRGAMHDVGIFIGALFAADKLVEIGSRSTVALSALIYKLSLSPVALSALIGKLVKIGSQYPAASIALIVAAIIFIYLVTIRAGDWKLMRSLERELARDEAESETSTDDGDD